MNDQQNTQTKRRGRKPKGGKLISQNTFQDNSSVLTNQNSAIIVQLKCTTADIKDTTNEFEYNPTIEQIEPYSDVLNNNKYETFNIEDGEVSSIKDNTFYSYDEYNEKLSNLNLKLETMTVSNTKSACFWCTFDFNNSPIYIPKCITTDNVYVYGNFCSPECALAYLLHQDIDDTTKFERSHLLNNIYNNNSTNLDNIKPALNPYYVLKKYYGNLTIHEYRNLFKQPKQYSFIEKPMTLINPEFNEDSQPLSCSSDL